MLTPKGIFFLNIIQVTITQPKRRDENLQSFIIGFHAPIVHMNRHLSDGDFGYDQVTRLVGQGMDFIMGGGPNSPLGSYTHQSRVVFHLMMVPEIWKRTTWYT